MNTTKHTSKVHGENIRKISIHLVLGLMFVLNGCAFQSILFDTENERGGFVVTKPPIQVTYRGDISEVQHEHMLDVIREIKTIPYHDYKFNENHNVRLNTIDGKSDNVNIQLNEHTGSKETEITTSTIDE